MAFVTRKNKKFGFTLIEILVVIAIISVLTGVVLTSTTLARAKARDAGRISDMKEIQIGLAIYYDVNRSYPTATSDLLTDKYLPSLPTDPLTGTAYPYIRYNSNKSYCIGVALENTIPDDNVTHDINANCDALDAQGANYKAQSPN